MDVSNLATYDGVVEVEDGYADKNHSVDASVNVKLSHHTSQQLLDKIEKHAKEADAKTKELEQRLREAERNLGISTISTLVVPWRYTSVGAGPAGSIQNANNGSSKNTEAFKLSSDMYSVLSAWQWNTKPFWASLFVVSLQITLLSVLIVDLIGGAEVENILNLPGNVEYTVRIAQALAVPIAVFSQEDLRDGIEGLFQGMPHAFRGDVKLQCMKPMRWRFGCFLRFGQGFLSMFASFILLIQAETVFDLLLNFLGIEFISDLDNLSFRLAGLGYFGITTRDCVNTIDEADFHRDEKEADTNIVTFSPAWCRIYAHILGVFFIFMAMISSFIFYAVEQYDGEYLPSIVQVEFGDETLPFLGIFSGCYMARSGRGISERIVYEQMGRSTLQGKLAYCSDLDDGSWVLFYGKDTDACDNPIVSSGSTKTFDVVETAESQWYTNTSLPLEYLQIFRVDDEFGSCGSLGLLDATQGSCLEVEFDLEGRSSTFQKRQLSVSSDDKVVDAIRSHPIYVGANGTEAEVIIFTGRRWVLANSSKISSWETTTALLNDTGNEEFYDGLMNVNSEWILLTSEPIDGVNDQGTPLGLQWYFPRDTGEESNGFNFHISDLTRPVDLTCASCNSKTNPCLYEGVCNDETGNCECKNGASGKLCREPPFRDGTCNSYFNTLEFGYDSGDCCPSTCGVSACDDSRIAYPYGLDVLSKRQNESRAIWFAPFFGLDTASSNSFGYDECKDQDQANFAIEVKPSGWRILDPESPFKSPLLGFDADFDWDMSVFCTIDAFVVTCDDKPYMEISPILVARTDNIDDCPTYRQTFQAPYGASCELAYTNYMPFLGLEAPLRVKLLYGSDGAPVYEDESGIGGLKKVGWDVPASKCITDTFSNTSKSIFDNRTIEGAVVNRLSTSGRAIDWCESESAHDREILLERFALEALLTTLGSTETFGGEVQHCRVPLVGEGFGVGCDANDKVITLEVQSNSYATNGTLAEFMGFLPLLPKLQNLGIVGNMLTGPIPENEITKLHNLVFLALLNGSLAGTIPTEIASLQKLEHVVFTNNTLTGEIPTEFGSLPQLSSIQLEHNDLTGPAIPSELLALRNLTSYLVSNNRLNGSIPPEVQELERLLQLDLGSNFLTGTIPTQIGNLKDLTKLKLSNNRLNGSIPLDVENLSELVQCDILDGNSNMTGGSVGICT